MLCYEVVKAKGHENIRATHRTTIEITKDQYLTSHGDCIIGIAADKGALDLSDNFKACLRSAGSLVLIVLETSGLRDYVVAEGHPSLLLSDKNKIIIRKSAYIEPATLCIKANKAAINIKRELICRLRNPGAILTAHLYVVRFNQVTSANSYPRRVF